MELDECTYVSKWNAYDCANNLDFGVFEFEGIGHDRREISSAPVYLENT